MNSYSYSLSLPLTNLDESETIERLVAPFAETLEFSAKQVIFNLTDSLSGIYYIKSGKTSHFISDGSNEKLIYQLSTGAIFGNLAPDKLHGSDMMVVANEKTIVYKISRENYLKLLNENTGFAATIISFVCMVNQYMIEEIDNLSFNSCKTRLMRIYCSQTDTSKLSDDGKWYFLNGKLTHNELAAIVGSARVTISKLINELCEDGFLRIINRRTQISIDAYNKFIAAGHIK
ncbi:MAG: Crp/Fnr family transcriptional regulator [Clostridiaceae bacterium]|nr:Crp/Fnr family transcriptional regulator [Clostridiaceae bacterium]